MGDFAKLTPELKLVYWGDGKWVTEPDSFEFEYKGFTCFGKRFGIWDGPNADHLFGGQWNGYIILPQDHPWYGKRLSNEDFFDIEIHGGITYCDYAPTEWGDNKKFIIGFDCGHSYDLTPSMIDMKKRVMEDMLNKMPSLMRQIAENSSIFKETYRTYEFVVEEVKKLADQAKEAYETMA